MADTFGGRLTGGPSNRGNGKDVSQREDLANFISLITRDETPFMSSIGKTKATAIFHEWQTDELQAPGNSRITEGQDYVDSDNTDTLTPGAGAEFRVVGPFRTRLGNYTQINGKVITVSGTRRAIDQAGVADEYAYQLKKRGTEMRRDIEMDLVGTGNVSASFVPGGVGAGGRTLGGFQAWINADIDADFTGTPGIEGGTVAYAGTPVAIPAVGDAGKGADSPVLGAEAARGSLSLSDIDRVMQGIYQRGGKASRIMLSPKLRRDFSDLMVSDSGVRRNIDMDGKLRQSVDIYMSDFGDLMVVPNYIMGLGGNAAGTGSTDDSTNTKGGHADSSALIYDPMWFSIATLRPLQEVDVGQRGDSTVGMMVEECTMEVKNPIGCGAIYNLK